MTGRPGFGRDRRIVRAVSRWFVGHARDLPWRTPVRDPYTSLVSEFMLQQTQVARVLEKFGPFIDRFPTVRALAAADEQSVMAAWSGMGYYRRARNLQAAAREIVARFGGRIPAAADELLTLPGVGRYTAGAIASIVFDRPEPIVDGNVARVLMRVEGKELDPVRGAPWAWSRAAELVRATGPGKVHGAAHGPGVFNEGLMELGAVVCTPRGARCGVCPLRVECRATREGTVERIPRAKERGSKKPLYCAAVVVEDSRGRVLVERRPDGGMWGGLWQAPTLEGARRATRSAVQEWIGLSGLARVERFEHGTTHRRVEFEVWRGTGRAGRASATFKTRVQVAGLPLSNAQRRVLLGVAARGGAS